MSDLIHASFKGSDDNYLRHAHDNDELCRSFDVGKNKVMLDLIFYRFYGFLRLNFLQIRNKYCLSHRLLTPFSFLLSHLPPSSSLLPHLQIYRRAAVLFE